MKYNREFKIIDTEIKAKPQCKYCNQTNVVSNGKRKFTKRYKCKDCNKGFSVNCPLL